MIRTKKSTVRDVAAMAGVSLTTVHRVLYDDGYSTGAVQERVRAAVEALQYYPNEIAQSLRRRRSRLIGHVIPEIYPNQFFACVALGIEERGHVLGMATVTCNTRFSPEEERDYVDLLLRQRAEGIIFTNPMRSENVLYARDAGVPVCLVERASGCPGVNVVHAQDREGASEAVDYLLGLGHRRVAYVGAPPDAPTDQERYEGYRGAFAARGAALPGELIRFYGHSQNDGYRAVADLFALPDPPTAAFFAGDLLAVGAVHALWEREIRIPEDFSIVSMDDLVAGLMCPPLTTVSIPMREMGAAAVDQVLRREDGGIPSTAEVVVLPMQLVVRASCRSVLSSTAY